MMVAEELGCDWSRDPRRDTLPRRPCYAHTAYGAQMTGGSTSTWSEFDRYRQVGAMAREMLVAAAAAQWKVEPADCRAENGFVVAGAQRASYGSLAKAAAGVEAAGHGEAEGPEGLDDPRKADEAPRLARRRSRARRSSGSTCSCRA